VGTNQQFTATGTYSDGSTKNITNQATWTSSNTSVATVSATGLVTPLTTGSTTITATLGGITGSTNASAQVAVISITTSSLPAALVNHAYSATLAASGGVSPYTWSVATGALPTGLSLASTGQLTGTPTATGAFSFALKVSDSASHSATQSFSITVNSSASVFSSSSVPSIVDAGADSSVELGVKFKSDVNGNIVGVRFYKSAANTGPHVVNLWSTAGTLLATATSTTETASGWQQVNFAVPVPVTANTIYIASYHVSAGHYSLDPAFFAASGLDNSPLHLLQDGISGSDGVFTYGASSAFPASGYNASNYWVDVAFQ
jgi:hypothetical protein